MNKSQTFCLSGYELVASLWMMLVKSFDGAEPAMQGYGLHQKSLVLLTLLKDGCSPQELAHELRSHPSTLSHLIKELESRGLIHRTIHPRDKRKFILTRTPEGDKALAEGVQAMDDFYHDKLAQLTDEERGTLLASLKIMAKMLDSTEKHPAGD